MPKLILFDVDGTLLLSGGAGLRALNVAFEEVFKCSNGFSGLVMQGRTDSIILAEAMAIHKLDADNELETRFHDRYCDYLAQEIYVPGPRKGVMPGVRELLEAIRDRDDICSALLTGNFAKAARIKLEYFDLWNYFSFGAYADDASDRDGLVAIAVERSRVHGVPELPPHNIFIVGDTPLDVACANSAGVKVIAVATGSFDRSTLLASGAEVVLEDLKDTSAFLELLGQ